jgi:D-alanyl-D-alanine dipeptidase
MFVYDVIGWVSRTLGFEKPPRFTKRSWSDCCDTPPNSFSQTVRYEDLVNLESYRSEERGDALHVLPAYAQDSRIFKNKKIITATPDEYEQTPMDERLNKFRQAYKTNAPLLLHKHLADVLVDAAIDMKQRYGWNTVALDGLRTMESGFLLYHNAKDEWLADGLLSAPGKSAHNRALAVDSMQFDAEGNAVDMGGHFDHSNMENNHRNYDGAGISAQAKHNRILREQAFQRAALKHNTVIAPLREEFWDDRVPGSEKDLWRVMESICRCIGEQPPEERAEDYSTFARQWENYLDKKRLGEVFGDYALHPPLPDRIVYHESIKPIFDHDLPVEARQALIDPAKLPGQAARAI